MPSAPRKTEMLYLQLRGELWKLFGKKRTYIGFTIILLTQLIVTLVFKYTRGAAHMRRTLEANGYLAEHFLSGLTVATVMLVPIAYVLLPLYVALIGGDLVAKEAEDGTLRMILSRPISRIRLLLVKWLAGAVFAVLLVAALAALGVFVGHVFFRFGALFVFIPGELFSVFSTAEGWQHYGVSNVLLMVKAISIMSAAFMFSCFNVKPAAATILALSFFFVNAVLQEIPYFREYQQFFFTHHLNMWQLMFGQPIPWWKVGQSLSVLAGFNVSFLVIGCAAFHARDIKS
jgi:ABC-2 type transport system permease protein